MKQVVQSLSGGPVRVMDVPRPTIDATEVLVRTVASIISPGTERAVTGLAQSSLLAKARARPDLVRQVIARARTEGVSQTIEKVRTRLGGDIPLGYSASGIAVEVGEAVAGIRPGQLVATGGAGKANHAEWQAVPGLLCSAVPTGVTAEDAAFATIASIALHGLRLADLGPGSKVVVIGLGLIGQLAARLAQASGCDVAGIDIAPWPVEIARSSGAEAFVDAGDQTTAAIVEWSRGRGADAVLLAAAGPSSAAVQRAPALCRDQARIVVVGDIGLELTRAPFYERGLSLHFARSYGPGRYERSYEDWAVDYPAGFVRWTEGRNLEAVLDLLAAKRVEVGDLVTHRWPIADAATAYKLVESRSEPYLGVALQYPERDVGVPPARPPAVRVAASPRRTATAVRTPGIGLIGAGAFASAVLMPSFKHAGFTRLVSVASASGLSASRLSERLGFEKEASRADDVIEDHDVDVVVIATPHDTHADLTVRALQAGKHVWCEKPLALTMDELDRVEQAWTGSDRVLFVGFNRRYSPALRAVHDHFAGRSGPLVITYRVNAGVVPQDHWYKDRRQGGRLIGEGCHFVDACEAIVSVPADYSSAIGWSGNSPTILTEDYVLVLRYPEGSLAAISCSSRGFPGGEKERIEILGSDASVTVSDFRRVDVAGGTSMTFKDGKGHEAAARAFLDALQGRCVPASPFGAHQATIQAADSLRQ